MATAISLQISNEITDAIRTHGNASSPGETLDTGNTGEEKGTNASTPTLPQEDESAYPEGGLQAWSVVFGAFCGTAASIGLYNTSGVFEAYLLDDILPNETTSTIGWIFGLYAFVTWFLGVQVGPIFDIKGPFLLLIAGSICTVAGVLSFSACTEYYQIILAFSLLTGAGTSLLMTPAFGSVTHWFYRRRGLASGVGWLGSGVGGVIFPLMLQSLIPQIGWAWSLRAFALVLLVLCAISVTLCRSRLPASNGSATKWRDALPSTKIFFDGTGAMAVTTVGTVFTDLAYFIPVTYIPSYYIRRANLSASATPTNTPFAFQLLAISNASSCIGRLAAGHISDRLGRYNTMIISLFLCTVSVLCFWLPDILLPETSDIGLLLAFVILFGCVSGSNVSLLPVCLGQLCNTKDFGRYYATCYTVVAFGALLSIPIAGALYDGVDANGKAKFWGVAVFTGLCYVVATLCFVWVRWRVKGADWRTKW